MRSRSPALRVLLAGALWLVAAFAGLGVGLAVGLIVPGDREGLACPGVPFTGGFIGAALAMVAAAWAGHRLGLS